MSDGIESDDDIGDLASGFVINDQTVPGLAVDGRRAHHNALERKRRDHIKDSFLALKEAVPTLKGERASRALILRKACDYIDGIKSKISAHEQDIEQLKSQNAQLEEQILAFETANEVLERCGPQDLAVVSAEQSGEGAPFVPSTSVQLSTGQYTVTRTSPADTTRILAAVDVNDPHGLFSTHDSPQQQISGSESQNAEINIVGATESSNQIGMKEGAKSDSVGTAEEERSARTISDDSQNAHCTDANKGTAVDSGEPSVKQPRIELDLD